MKVVINTNYSGFDLSDAAFQKYLELKGITYYINEENGYNRYYKVPYEQYKPVLYEDKLRPLDAERFKNSNALILWSWDIPRDDPTLIQIVEEMGNASYGDFSVLKIVEIPDDISWQICDYDGQEWVAETHRTWR